jgi:hypothetical protein
MARATAAAGFPWRDHRTMADLETHNQLLDAVFAAYGANPSPVERDFLEKIRFAEIPA